MTKKTEYVYIFSTYHCNDGKRRWTEREPMRKVKKVDFDKTMKKFNENFEKEYKKTEGGWYVKK